MLVGGTQRAAHPGGVKRRTAPRRAAQHEVGQAPAAPLPAVPHVGNPSIAHGPWPVNGHQAKADAQRILNSIDFSKRDIVIWVPGTSHHNVSERFAEAVHASWEDGNVTLTHLEYPATWDLRPSVATGIATLKLVLAGIAAHTGNHRVMLVGESQGAWVLGEALADPALRKVVDRAVLFGHPTLAKTHFSDRRDPGILEVNDPHDHIAAPLKGDPTTALEALVALNTGQFWRFGTIGDALAANMEMLPSLIRNAVANMPFLKNYVRNAHAYEDRFTQAIEFLRTGDTAAAAAAAAISTTAALLGAAPRVRRRASRPLPVSPAA